MLNFILRLFVIQGFIETRPVRHKNILYLFHFIVRYHHHDRASSVTDVEKNSESARSSKESYGDTSE